MKMIDNRQELFDVIEHDIRAIQEEEGCVKVQLCGRITGDSSKDYIKKFADATRHLEKLGYVVTNPIVLTAELTATKGDDATWQDYMGVCLESIEKQDVLAILPCAAQSDGAVVEMLYASKEDIAPVRLERFPDLKLMTIHNWSTFTKPHREGKLYVTGNIYNDIRGKFEDDSVIFTSSVQDLDRDNGILTTRSSTYRLVNERK